MNTNESIIEKAYGCKISPLASLKRLRAGRYPLFSKEGEFLPFVKGG
jgi:hypothetical protein